MTYPSGADVLLLAGSANRELAEGIRRDLGAAPETCAIERFPDGEVSIRLLVSVRHREVFLIQPTSPPVNENVMELLALADACVRAAAKRVVALVPYFGYARQDKRLGRREPITASLVAHLMQTAGIDHVITVDLHTPQVEGFFSRPVDSLTAVPTLSSAIRDRVPRDFVVVAPDVGRVQMAAEYARRLGGTVVVLHKRRDSATRTVVTHVVGDVRDRPCLLVDDMISTGGTIEQGVHALLEAGARPEIVVAATHGLLLSGAEDRLAHPAIRDIFVTDTVPHHGQDRGSRLHVVSVAPLLAEAIRRFVADMSLSELS